MMCSAKPAYRQSRNGLFISCATVAMATAALLPQKAQAQAFQGNVTSTTGTVTRANTTATSETITIGSPTATINWTPTGQANANGNLDFLPSGNVATFQGTGSAGNYTVLNRIIPSGATPIELNGTVQSFLSDNTTGGNIWFYSPNGILIGATAVFNVGGLLLTTADPGNNWSASANGFTANMGPASSSSFVTVSNGAQINAQNSYVAIVAPKITQAGTVNVNGSAAYVAAEQATLTFHQGLFDIAVDVGTDDPNGIVHTGTTTGTGNATSADNHSIYMVAVPKNQALTMLLGGHVGFTDVQGATVQNGQIVLSAGYNVTSGVGAVPIDGFQLGGAFPSKTASIDIEGGNFTSDVQGFATGSIIATGGAASEGSGTLNFAHDVSLQGLLGASLIANAGDTITVGGNATISADDKRSFDNSNSQDPLNATAGTAQVIANSGGSIHVGGNLSVTADAQGAASVVAGIAGGSAQAGTARLQSNGGSISIGGNATVSASANGGNSVATGGDGDGGDAFMTLNGGSIMVGGTLALQADGQGGSGAPGGGGFGGWAEASLTSAGGTLAAPGGLRLESNGMGGQGLANPDGVGGDGGEGAGGSATFSGTSSLQAGASLNIQLSNVGLIATGLGGKGGDGLSGGAGGDASGGEAFADLGSVPIGLGQLNMQTTARGGDGGAASSGTGGAGGDAFGGIGGFFAQGSVTANVQTDVGTTGGAGGAGPTKGSGGNAEGGGLAFMDIAVGGSLTGSVYLASLGIGGDGASGGEGLGGSAELFVEGSLNSPEVIIDSSGTGGNGLTGDGGFSQGGAATLFIDSGGVVNVTNDLLVGAAANTDRTGDGVSDGSSGAVNGGSSDGGSAAIIIGFGGGSLTVGGTTGITARAVGGAGGANDGVTGGTGGDAQGGEADFFTTGTSCVETCAGAVPASSTVTNVALHDLTLNAAGLGGAGGNAATGGAGGGGNGGFTEIDIDNAKFSGADITANARGLGGTGGAGSSGLGGAGGFAQGGDNFFLLGSSGAINASTYLGFTNARGGDGGTSSAGSGDGGSADSGFNEASINGIATFGGSSDDGTGFVMTAFAQGGNGQTAGSASAGGSSITISGTLTASGYVQASASAIKGNGSGGTAEAGSASIDVAGTLGAGNLAIIANGLDSSLGNDGSTFGGTAQLDLESGAATNLADVVVSAKGSDGAVSILGNLSAAGAVDFESGGDIAFANVTAGKLDFDARGSITGGDIAVADHVGGQADGAITLGNITAGPNLPTSNDGFSVGIASATSITVGNVTGAGGVGFATLGGLTTGNVTAGDLFLALVGGDASFGSVATASDGRVYIGNASMFTAAGGTDNFDPNAVLALAPVATGGSVTFGGAVTTGQMQAAAGTGLKVGDVTAGTSVDVSAGGLADFEGKVSAPDITVTSSDINIAAGASLGVFGVTNLLTLNAVSGQPIIIGQGGSPAAGQYVLDEQGDIQAASVIFNALGSDGGAAPDIDIFAVNIDGSQTSGGGASSVTLNTGGSIIVGGAVKYADAAPTDTLTLNAGKNLEVITDKGSISITNSSGGLSGALTLKGDNVWVASQAIISALEASPASVTPDQLATNSGASNPNGFVSAGGITADIGSSFLVQNSGTADDLAGLTVGDGGLTIATAATTAAIRTAAATGATVDIFARQIKSDGTTITGKDFVPTVKVSGTFTTESTINGCPVGGCAPPPPPPPPSTTPAQTLASDQVLGPIGSTDSSFVSTDEDQQQQSEEAKKKDKGGEDEGIETWLGLINAGPINFDQPIDEPVTSGSDIDINFGREPDGSN